MSDLISRLSELRSQYSCFDESERDTYHTLSEAIEALQERKTGKWKLLHKGKDTSDYECTNCLGILMDVANDDTHELQSYCGMCGARMVGEEE